MSSLKPQIIIAGGGIAGLALANMLERFGIDYVLLEGHKDIAPAVGASIGLFPNGLRILDQIGCYEPIQALDLEGLDGHWSHIRDRHGKPVESVQDRVGHMKRRFGYPLLFFDRQWLLQILYDQLKHKDKVRVDKKVASVSLRAGGVEVTTTDGSVFCGSFLVGADGVHSTVRREMLRLGHQSQPGYFDPGEMNQVPCHYKCSFGIAQHVPNWKHGEQHAVLGRGRSQLVVSGPKGKVYWFLFVRLSRPRYGKDIPRYTKEDEARFVGDHISLPITDNVTFGQVYSCRISSSLTPLHEFVLKKWFYDRVLLLGDSVHKAASTQPNPIGGQGGNGAIESAAELVNALLDQMDSLGPGTGLAELTDRDIGHIFTKVQSSRFARAQQIVALSHRMQALNAYEKPLLSTWAWRVASPLYGDEAALSKLGLALKDGTTLKRLPVPFRPRAIPYTDELPERPLAAQLGARVRLLYLALVGLLLLLSFRKFLGLFPWLHQVSLTYTMGEGGAPGSYGICIVLSQLVAPALKYTIEGYRTGNRGCFISVPWLFTALVPVMGFGRVASLHALMSVLQGFHLPTGRHVPPDVVNSILPALVVGYIGPMAMMESPRRQVIGSFAAATAPFAPGTLWPGVLFPLSVRLISTYKTGRERTTVSRVDADADKPHFDRYHARDVPGLRALYASTAAAQTLLHVATLAYLGEQAGMSLLEAIWSAGAPSIAMENGTFDLRLGMTVFVASNLFAIWELRSYGYITTIQVWKAALGVVAGHFLVGSGTAWAGLWYWREQVLCSLGR
ncbi:FAD binding domain protein [Apiospora saccharicola]